MVLWAASDAGHSDMVKVLLKWGAEVNSVSKEQTLLQCAIAGGHGDVSEMLIAAGGGARATRLPQKRLHSWTLGGYQRST